MAVHVIMNSTAESGKQLEILMAALIKFYKYIYIYVV